MQFCRYTIKILGMDFCNTDRCIYDNSYQHNVDISFEDEPIGKPLCTLNSPQNLENVLILTVNDKKE